jgi:adenine-specific DNA-methyltransferase
MMAGKFQCIYIDPPYGIKFSSNFQPKINKRDVGEKDDDLAREPEQIKAYRDTWELGIHSYLAYLRDRLMISRDLLSESGSVFVQISDKNMHHVKELMDEIFGAKNQCSTIAWKKAAPTTKTIRNTFNYILWYCKNIDEVKVRKLYRTRQGTEGTSEDPKKLALWADFPNGETRSLTTNEKRCLWGLPEGTKVFRIDKIVDRGETDKRYKIKFNKKEVLPKSGYSWRGYPDEMNRLLKANRVVETSEGFGYKFYLSDYPVIEITNFWEDTAGKVPDMIYTVQTNTKLVQRCILMTSDPGDLVFDPTCGSGTTAFVAEQWGRRWITCDTSRVALSLARQRIMTSIFPFYTLQDEVAGVKSNFIYKEEPHITLTSIAQDEPPETISRFDMPNKDTSRIRVSGPFTVEGIPQHSVSEFEAVNYETELQQAGGQETPAPKKIDAATHIQTLTELLRKDGVTFPKGKTMKFENLTPVSGSSHIHAEGEPVKANGIKRVAISFGPAHGPVTVRQVEGGIREANVGGYNAIVFCGLAFDSSAMDVPSTPNVQVFYSHIRPDVMMSDLLKTTASSQLFTVFGEPDIEVKKKKKEYQVILKGVDIYDPLTGEVYSDNGDSLAAWFVDTDYDKRSFCISQAFFPDKNAWNKLKRALKAEIDEDKFDMLTSTTSIPFEAGEQRQIAVKVIDHRGNEVMVVRELG